MNSAAKHLLIAVIVCLLAAILGKLWQLERAIERAEALASCPR